MIFLGKFGQPSYDMDDGSEEAAKSARTDEGQGGYEDIPILPPEPEIYDEQILEAEEMHEASTIRDNTPIFIDSDLARSKRSNNKN